MVQNSPNTNVAEIGTNMALTDTAVKKLKPAANPRKISDGGGLHLLVTPQGSKLWRLAYRFGGKQKLLALGVYPDVGLAGARRGREEAKRLLRDGVDPGQARKIEKAKRAVELANDFQSIGREFIAKAESEGSASKTMDRMRRLMGYANTALGDRPIGDIDAPELLGVLRLVEARGTHETAHRLRVLIGQIFRYAIATGRATRNPVADLRDALIVKPVAHRATIVKPTAIGALLRAIDGYQGQPATKAALQLAPLLFLRPGELRQGRWEEIDFDAAVWIVPAPRMKLRREHRVPLAHQAIAVLEGLQRHTGHRELLFPAVGNPRRSLSENTLNAALRRIGYAGNEMSAHGFRAMASTRLNEMGKWNPDAIERQLAHQERNDVRRAYTHPAEYWVERVRMMQAWANYLDELRAAE